MRVHSGLYGKDIYKILRKEIAIRELFTPVISLFLKQEGPWRGFNLAWAGHPQESPLREGPFGPTMPGLRTTLGGSKIRWQLGWYEPQALPKGIHRTLR